MFLEFKLEKRDREVFKKPWGRLYKNIDEVKKLIEGEFILVGDRCTKTAIEAGLKPTVAIVDGRIKRKKVKFTDTGLPVVDVENEAGMVRSELWREVQRALRKKRIEVRVQGEEDLAVIPVAMLAPSGTQILYGQPNEGVVLITVTDALKEKLGRFLYKYVVKSGKKFMNSIKPKEKVFMVYHTDSDGISAASILLRALKKKGVKKIETACPNGSPEINEDMQAKIIEYDPDVLIVVDMGNESARFLKKMAEERKVGVFGHHRFFGEDFGQATVVNPLLFHAPENLNPSASYLVYRVTDGPAWLTAVGSIGDRGDGKISELIEQVKDEYELTLEQLKELSATLDSAEAYKDGKAPLALEALQECEAPKDLLKPSSKSAKLLKKYRTEIKTEIERLKIEHTKKAEIFSRLVIYQVESKFGLKGNIANYLQEEYPNKVILVWSDRERIRLSLRTQSPIDVASLVKKHLKDLDGKGGGHKPAAGAEIAKPDFPKLLERIKEDLK